MSCGLSTLTYSIPLFSHGQHVKGYSGITCTEALVKMLQNSSEARMERFPEIRRGSAMSCSNNSGINLKE